MEEWMEDVLRRVPQRIRSSLRDFLLPFSAKTKPVADMTCKEVCEFFRLTDDLSFDWSLEPHERKTVPDYLKSILEDYNLCMAGSRENEALVRTRLDAILMTTLAAKKKGEWGQTWGASMESVASYKSLHLQFETPLKCPVMHKNREIILNGRADYSLWYETVDEPESNMVVVEAKAHEGDRTGEWQTLTYMAIIHSARKKAGRSDTTIYGVATDSHRFIFMRLDNNSKWSKLETTWDTPEGAITVISHLHKIMDHAAMLSPVATRQSASERKRPMEDPRLEETPSTALRLGSIEVSEPFDPFRDTEWSSGNH
ncbi:hypothetical protein DTO195F2_1886 [Paecilomyces variotii]|nr:hypothetical protein DTO195F2_1886 [Paecilomyces variotii]